MRAARSGTAFHVGLLTGALMAGQGRHRRLPVGTLESHPLYPLSPPIRSIKRLGVVAPVPPYLPVSKLEYHRHVEHLPTAALVDRLNYPQPFPDEHSTQPHRRKGSSPWEYWWRLYSWGHVLRMSDAGDRLSGVRHQVLNVSTNQPPVPDVICPERSLQRALFSQNVPVDEACHSWK